MNKTNIEYLDYTWNPLAMRCTAVSAGCANCWHLAMADRMAHNPKIPADQQAAYRGDSGPVLVEERLEEPLRSKTPSIIGVQFMGDLFHDDVPLSYIDRILEVIAACPQHWFLVLTKRVHKIERKLYGVTEDTPLRELGGGDYLPNLWLGVTVENQRAADERIPVLLQIPAAVHWLSVEPLLGPVELFNVDGKIARRMGERAVWWPAECVDWVVAGCESGPHRRPAETDWFRDLRDQCKAAGVPFFLKQMDVETDQGSRIEKMPGLDNYAWSEMPEGMR